MENILTSAGGIVPVMAIMLVIGCDQEKTSSPTTPAVGLNFQQAGDPDDVDSDVCQKGYGIHLKHGDAEKGHSGQITLRLPVGNYTILYDTEGAAGNSKEVIVTSRKNWRVFIGTLAEHGLIVNVVILNNDTGVRITAVLNGIIQEDAVCALDDKFGQLPKPEPVIAPSPVTYQPCGKTWMQMRTVTIAGNDKWNIPGPGQPATGYTGGHGTDYYDPILVFPKFRVLLEYSKTLIYLILGLSKIMPNPELGQLFLKDDFLRLIVFDEYQEVITAWIPD